MPVKASEVVLAAGITYRQLDHWATSGYIPGMTDRRGSGNIREWTPAQTEHVTLMGDLVRNGMAPFIAANFAADLMKGKKVWIGKQICMERVVS
jgi:hypothetical protein